MQLFSADAKGPFIKDVGKFLRFLTPTLLPSAVFYYYPSANLGNFCPPPLKNANVLNEWSLRENKLEYWLTKIALANGVAWRIGVAWALFKVSVTTFEDTTISVEVTVWLPSSDVIKYVNVLYSVLITLVGCICPACIMEKRNRILDIYF